MMHSLTPSFRLPLLCGWQSWGSWEIYRSQNITRPCLMSKTTHPSWLKSIPHLGVNLTRKIWRMPREWDMNWSVLLFCTDYKWASPCKYRLEHPWHCHTKKNICLGCCPGSPLFFVWHSQKPNGLFLCAKAQAIHFLVKKAWLSLQMWFCTCIHRNLYRFT